MWPEGELNSPDQNENAVRNGVKGKTQDGNYRHEGSAIKYILQSNKLYL